MKMRAPFSWRAEGREASGFASAWRGSKVGRIEIRLSALVSAIAKRAPGV